MPVGSILFAAGRGERLRPLTDVVPKPALPVLDIPLAAFSLEHLERARPPVVVNVSHLADRVIAALGRCVGSGSFRPLIEMPAAYGTAGTVRAVAGEVSDPLVTCNGDILADADVGALLEAHERLGAPATVVVVEVDRQADLVVEGDRAVRFVDRRVEPDVGGVRFAGLSVLGPAAVERIPDRRPLGLGEAVLRPLADAGELAVVTHDGYWRDVGTVAAYLAAALDVLHGRLPPPVELPGEVVELGEGRAYVGPGAVVAGAEVGPGAIVGADAVVGRGGVVQDAIVWPGETVPEGAEVRRAVWAQGRVHPVPLAR